MHGFYENGVGGRHLLQREVFVGDGFLGEVKDCCGFEEEACTGLCQVVAIICLGEVAGVVFILAFDCEVLEFDLFNTVYLVLRISWHWDSCHLRDDRVIIEVSSSDFWLLCF